MSVIEMGFLQEAIGVDVNTERQQEKTKAKSFWSRLKTMLLISSFLGLGSLNITTLVSDKAHAIGYNLLQTILGSAVTDDTLAKLLSHSPTAKRNSDVAVATRAIVGDKAALTASNHALSKKYVELERSHKDISIMHAQLKAANAKQAAVAQNISKKIAFRSAKAATRNVSSLAGEAIPMMGNALIIGVTAWDIYDLCETMKDINEINVAFGHPLEDEKSVCGMKVPSKEKVLADLKKNWQVAYKTAADSVNQAGNTMVAPTRPSVSWSEMKASICPLVGSISPFCR